MDVNNSFLAVREGDPTPEEKVSRSRADDQLTEKVDWRSTVCNEDFCLRAPTRWIREIQYDMERPGQPINHRASISTADYAGPIPGYCVAHSATGPRELARVVFFDRPEIQLGYRPSRYTIIYTDGIQETNEIRESPISIVQNTHTRLVN